MGEEDRRIHARVHVAANIEVAGKDGLQPAVLKDLSRSGARFVAVEPVGVPGETLELFLPSLSGEDIGVEAEVASGCSRPTKGP